jgi:hypothetical protein
MAIKNGCCAVSKNSSFFIFDLPSGYIPCDALFVSNRHALCLARSVLLVVVSAIRVCD